MDVFSKEKRSEIMAKISGRNTKPELLVRSILHHLGYRFRIHVKDLPGKPDIVLPRHKKIILVHGCFWHGHRNCKRAKLPTTNIEFWESKIGKNKKRDSLKRKELMSLGYKVLVIWTCSFSKSHKVINSVKAFMEK